MKPSVIVSVLFIFFLCLIIETCTALSELDHLIKIQYDQGDSNPDL